ncbi:MAG: tRNA (adenosine(37)-N6)-dimethylallyltransferase MiaA [Candidatus Moranbacteria bacterium]|nr:tRNA (adenosine(37)-N6)-dimethylallyltransferase MiaA [Candidatus Moranbacteria bacterium]
MSKTLQKTIVIMGPTASGKSDLAITLARKYDGEIISADSRQVYRGMDIGTGKVPRDLTRISNSQFLISKQPKKNIYFSEGIRHHLIDVASPKKTYNVTHFIRDAKKALVDIKQRDKTPIICGGTGFWIQALLEDHLFPAVKPNPTLRKVLEKLSTEVLFRRLKRKDPARAKNIDAKNKVRLIRALEIVQALGKVPPLQKNQESGIKNQDSVILALSPDQSTLYKNIKLRLEKRLKRGMIAEVKKLREEDLSWKRLESFGLEYKYVALLLQKKISRKEMEECLEFEIRHYAKRQLTWLRRFEKMSARIHWVTKPEEVFSLTELHNSLRN